MKSLDLWSRQTKWAGDYYDIINKKNKDWVVIGDVSGHVVPAGVVMMMVQTAIHTSLEQNPDLTPSNLLTIINRAIFKNIKRLDEDRYMTMTVFTTHNNGDFTFAGLHQNIFVYRAAARNVESIETDGAWIGLMDEVEGLQKDNSFTLNSGDVLLLITDGVTEARNKENKSDMFGEERLCALLKQVGTMPLIKIKEEIINALQDFEWGDDVTFVLLRKI